MARIVVVGPHPDDQELGMGGTIALLAAQGHDVLLLDVTDGEPTPLGDHDTRNTEAAEALRRINAFVTKRGGTPVQRWLLGLKNREVVHTPEARRLLAAAYRAWAAQWLFVPYPDDAHPDHVAVSAIARDARFDAKLSKLDLPPVTDGWTGTQHAVGEPRHPERLVHYFCTHLKIVPEPSFVFDTTQAVGVKFDAVRAYESQFVKPEKNRAVVKWLESMDAYFGSRIGTQAGEPFFLKEPLGLRSLEGTL